MFGIDPHYVMILSPALILAAIGVACHEAGHALQRLYHLMRAGMLGGRRN